MTTRPATAVARPDTEPVRRFRRLAEQWENEGGGRSISKQIMDCPAFRALVAMGEPIVPLILDEMEQSHLLWHLALQEITGERPIHTGARGDMAAVYAAWREWGRRRYPAS